MRGMELIKRLILSLTFLMSAVIMCRAEGTTSVKITVIDSISSEPVPYAAIFLKGTGVGVLTDERGTAELGLKPSDNVIEISVLGYTRKLVSIPDYKRRVTVRMHPDGVALDEIVIRKKRDRYSKRNNPAVTFMERIRSASDATNPRRNDNFNYNKYERITIGLNNFTDKDQQNVIFKRFPFLREYVDTSEVSGRPILNMSVKEKASEIHYRRSPRKEKELVTGIRRKGIDQMTSQESMQTLLEDVFREIDLYDNDINILRNRFVSPLSSIGADFYKYYLTDTVDIGGERCIELSFTPRTRESFGFSGRLYVPENDSTMFVKQVVMNVPPGINLNFIEQLYLKQTFERAPDGSRLKTVDDMIAEIVVVPGTQGLYVRRNTAYSGHDFSFYDNDELFSSLAATVVSPQATSADDDFWAGVRYVPITRNEQRIDDLLAQLRSVPVYYWTEKVLKMLVSGYIHTAPESKIDIGPVNTLVSTNDIEGVRFRLGGMTTAHLSPHWFARGYVAYGTKDRKFKYKGELEYSFNAKDYHSREFPVHSLRLTHLYDIDMIGQHYMFTNMDNVFLSWKRMKNEQITYHHVTDLTYTLELRNNFSLTATAKHERQEATQFMPFVNGRGRSFGHYDETTFSLQLRYAPGEKFYQTKSHRVPINLDAPVIVLEHTYGPANAFGNMFEINRTELSAQKRFWFSAFGFTDIIVRGGHIWSATPYPNLLMPNANLSYTIQPESFALMNPMEFVSDTYASWDVTYWANGAIFNYVPLLKKLKLREVFAFRGYIGALSDKNNPECNPEVFVFPQQAHVTPMHGKPYMEASVGIDNLLKCLRVDYVWRLNYHDVSGVDKRGVRIAFHVTF